MRPRCCLSLARQGYLPPEKIIIVTNSVPETFTLMNYCLGTTEAGCDISLVDFQFVLEGTNPDTGNYPLPTFDQGPKVDPIDPSGSVRATSVGFT